MWEKIRKKLFKPKKNTYISNGATFIDNIGVNRDYHIMTYKRLFNEYKYGTIDEVELIEKLTKAKDTRSNHMMYRIKDYIQAFRTKAHEGISAVMEKVGYIDRYTYEAKLEACNICSVKDGKTWKSWKDIDNRDKPLIHFGCICSIVSSKGDIDSEFKKLTATGWVSLQTKKVRRFIKKRAGMTAKMINEKKLHISYEKLKELLS